MTDQEIAGRGTRRPVGRRTFLAAAGAVPAAIAFGQLTRPAAASAATTAADSYSTTVAAMATESLVTPLGVDVAAPRLSWAMRAGQPGWSQSAYRIRVASSEAVLLRGGADVWDSGVVKSAQSADVDYGGPALQSATRYYWSVQVTDANGATAPWSASSWWETGLLAESDWSGAQWIAPPLPTLPSLTTAHWIWYPEGAADSSFPAETRYFRKDFTLPAGATVTSATLVMTADDYYTVYVNGTDFGGPGQVTDGWQTAQIYDVTSALTAGGANTIAASDTNLQALSGGVMVNTPAGLLGHLHIELSTGAAVDIVTDGSWLAAQTVPDGWTAPSFDDSSWVGALDQGQYGGGPWGSNVQVPEQIPAPYMRSEFSVGKPVRQARLSISGLGYYVASINGKRVGDHMLDPGPTVFNENVMYSTYDVTDLVRRGENAIGVVLGRGFYAIDSPNIYWNTAPWLSQTPVLLAKLVVEQADGSEVTLVSGPDWLTTDSPTLTDSVYNGETYDARKAIVGWDMPGLDTSGWTASATPSAPAPSVSSQLMPPIRVVETVEPTAVVTLAPGSYRYEFPAVIAGWPVIAVSGPAGTEVIVRYAEKLNSDGTVDNTGDPGITPGEIQRDNYILAGTGVEDWEPRFSYGSFQYIQVDGLSAQPPAGAIKARVAHTDVPLTGDFHSSDELLNTIHAMSRRTILNNLTGVPTDTPMYEKRGWFGDAQLYTAPAVDNFDLHAFLTNFLRVQATDQGGNGNYGDLAPANGPGEGGDPTWSSAGLVIPWRLYTEYGDSDVLAAHYASMKAFVDYLTGVASGSLVSGTYGDWEAPLAPESSYSAPPEGTQLVSTASYYRCAVILAQAAQVLGNQADATTYAALAQTVKSAFNAAFLDASTGIYQTSIPAGYRQTSSAFPLYLGMVPSASVSAVVSNLVAGIAANGNYLNTGIVGTMALFPALTTHGNVDLAYTVATQTGFPSYGYWVGLGATTLWEEWAPDPRSHDHGMFGTVDDWFFKYLAGIQPAAPGYKQISVQPYVPTGLTEVDAYQTTPYGRVAVRWQVSGGRFRMGVTVPPNTTATVSVPSASGGYSSYRVGSGEHTFTA